jgi:glycosyltransferase involved in cell wall biosynthesis
VPEKVKILHVIKSLGRGGAEMLLPETLKLHDQSRFEFHYIYFLPWKNQLVQSISVAGGKVTCLSASNNIRILLKYRDVVRYIEENQIQLIHCHLPWAGMVSRWVFRKLNIPVVYTEHNKQERYHFATRLMNKFTFNWQTAVIAVSADVADSIRKNISPSIPIYEILNGVNTESFQRDKDTGVRLREDGAIPEHAIVVGTVAVFRFQKRLIEWLTVFSKAYEKNNNLFGIIVGDGPLRKDIEMYRNKLGLQQRVWMPGLQTEVKPWYSAMDVFMMTSIFEGLPIALLEAMSMGCTIVTTDAGGIKEVISNDKNGKMVSVDSWNELSEVLITVSNEKSQREKLGIHARQRVIESFSLIRMVNELEKLYIGLTK